MPPVSVTMAAGITVDKRLRTSNRHVYAIGDVAGAAQFTHAANHHAGAGDPPRAVPAAGNVDADAIPRVTFTDPELAHVGCQKPRPASARRPSACCAGRIMRTTAPRPSARPRGHIKVVTDKKGTDPGRNHRRRRRRRADHHLDAGHQPGPQYPRFRRNCGALSDLSEIGKRAAISFFTPRLSTPWVRRILGLLRRLG